MAKKEQENTEKEKKDPNLGMRIIQQSITEEMKDSYIDYAMSVITMRALPDVRDGLKPVHRRILFAMHGLGLTHTAKFRKSAAVVGEVLGKYHPHGDSSVYDAMVKMAQYFSYRYPLVIGQGNFGCFTKDTKVKLTDGRSLSFAGLIKEDDLGKKNYTYTINKEGKIEIALITKPRLTKKKVAIIKVVLDNNAEIKCTLDHKFLLKDGTYVEAEKLQQGTSLMPLYTRLSTKEDTKIPQMKGYEMVLNPNHKEWIFTHHIADNHNISHEVYSHKDGRVRHHVDFNKLNNNPDNIKRMHWKDHWDLHSNMTASRHKNDPVYVKKLVEGRKRFWDNEENRKKYSQRISKRNKDNWKNAEYREKMRGMLSVSNKAYMQNHPEKRVESSVRLTKMLKKLWQTKEYREVMRQNIIKGNKNHTTNKTGKVKFDKICALVLKKGEALSEDAYKQARLTLYPNNLGATTWNTGLNKYYSSDRARATAEINGNHKVKKIIFLKRQEDVYDLTILGTHNFALAAGVFVHNSTDGDSPAAMRYCVTGDTFLPTNHGIEKIKDISNSEDINTQILSRDQHINTAVKWFDSGEHPTIKIKTKRGYALQGSHNHPILVWVKDSTTGRPSFQWKLLSKIAKGDVAVIDRTPDVLWPVNEFSLLKYVPKKKDNRTKVKQLPQTLSEDLAYILGALVAEGCIREKSIEFCNSDVAWIDDFEKRWKNVFPDCRLHRFLKQPSSYGRKPYYRLEVHSLYIIEFLKNIGLSPLKSKHKEIPFSVLQSPKSVVASFLRSYFEGDGSISHSTKMIELSAISTSKKLIDQLQIVLLRFGLASKYYYDKHRAPHKLYIRGLGDYILFQKEVGFISQRKKNKLQDVISYLKKDYSATDFVPHIQAFTRSILSGPYREREFASTHNFDRYPNLAKNYTSVVTAVRPEMKVSMTKVFETLLSYNYLFDPIEEVEEGGIERVYSLKVDSTCHSFIGNGFVNHNTEAKMSSISSQLVRDLEKETVDWRSNYDDTRKEPIVFPSAVPTLLLNGTLGIAVGMATKIPPHNLREIIGATVHLIDNKDATIEDLMNFVTGPDFPTGGIVYNTKDIMHAYASGRGGVVTRGEAEIVEGKGEAFQIIITSLPYQVNKADLVVKIAQFVKDKKIDGIKALRDESSRGDTRVVIDLKGGIQPQRVLNYLYKHTDLETTFHFNMLALVDGIPQILSLKSILEEFISHRIDVVKRRTAFDLKKANAREHILLGLTKALDHIDAIVKTIKSSKDAPEAHKNLIKKFKFSEVQATAILEMRLQKLAGLERKKIAEELKEIQVRIKELASLLGSPKKIRDVIKKELGEIADKYGDERMTKVVKGGVGKLSDLDLVPDEESVLVLTQRGYIKRTNPKEYRPQRRGGVGVIDLNTKEEDFITKFLTTSTHSSILFFSNKGKVYQTKMYEIPEGRRATKGKSIMNFLPLVEGESVTSVVAFPKDIKETKEGSLVMVTEHGVIKKVAIKNFVDVRRNGILAVKLAGGDKLLSAFFAEDGDDIILVTAEGQSIRFPESQVREMGRAAGGVRGIRLGKGDTVVGADVIGKDIKDGSLLVMTEKGLGKKTSLKEYKAQGRGGSGIKTAKVTPKTGKVIVAKVVTAVYNEIIAISKGSQVIRVKLSEIPKLGRQTQGVKVMKLRANDTVATFICL